MAELPPAASLDPDFPPAVRTEVETGSQTSVQEVWDKLRSTPSQTRRDWPAFIVASRTDRMGWLAAEEAGTTRKRKASGKAIAALMGGDEAAPKVKKTRARKAVAKIIV